MSKQDLKSKAISLRREGYSYSDIKKKINVSKSTLSLWLSSLPYIPNEYARQKIARARLISSNVKKKNRIDSINRAKEIARKDINNLTKRDLFMLGIGIYIGEGSKTHDIVRVSNSNPAIIRFMVVWFQKICGLDIKNLSIRLHVYPDNDLKECEQFWVRETGISTAQFLKPYIDVRINKKKSNGRKLSFGTAHLSIRSNGNDEFGVKLSRKICAWMDEVLG